MIWVLTVLNQSVRVELVEPMTKASVAAGADGLIIEMHTDPDHSMTGDSVQSLFPDQFAKLLRELELLAPLCGSSFATAKESPEFFHTWKKSPI